MYYSSSCLFTQYITHSFMPYVPRRTHLKCVISDTFNIEHGTRITYIYLTHRHHFMYKSLVVCANLMPCEYLYINENTFYNFHICDLYISYSTTASWNHSIRRDESVWNFKVSHKIFNVSDNIVSWKTWNLFLSTSNSKSSEQMFYC